jgi:hypothetical protein
LTIYRAIERIEMFEQEMRLIDRAADAAEHARAQLLMPDGSRRYADAVHHDRMAELTRAFEEATASAFERVDGHVQAARNEVETLESDSPIDRLSEADLLRANGRRQFVREDCETLPVPALVARCRAALDTNDVAGKFLLFRYAGRRLEAESGEPLAAGFGDRVPTAARPGAPGVAALMAVVGELGKALSSPKAGSVRERAREVGSAAIALRGHAYNAKVRATGDDPARDATRRAYSQVF